MLRLLPYFAIVAVLCPLSAHAVSSSETFRIEHSGITPGGARTTSAQFDLWGCTARIGAGVSSSPSYVLQVGCGAFRKAAASLDDVTTVAPPRFRSLGANPTPFRYATTIRYERCRPDDRPRDTRRRRRNGSVQPTQQRDLSDRRRRGW